MADINQVLANALGVNSLLGNISGSFVFPTGVIDSGSANKFIYFSPFEFVKAGDALNTFANETSNDLADLLKTQDTQYTGVLNTFVGNVKQIVGNIEQNGISTISKIGESATKAVKNAIDAQAATEKDINNRLLNKKHTQVGSIALPIPPNIVDGIQYGFDSDRLGNLGSALLGAGSAIGQGSTVNEALRKYLPNLLAGGVTNAVGNLATNVLGIDGQSLVRTAIGTPNPFLKLNFSGVDFKDFQFQFHLVARNKNDADAILKILSIFKYYSAPSGRDGAIFDVKFGWDIYFSPEVERYLFKFKPCYLVGISTTYNTGGQSAFHSNGAPVDVVLNLHFREMVVESQETYDQQYSGFLNFNGVGVNPSTQTPDNTLSPDTQNLQLSPFIINSGPRG